MGVPLELNVSSVLVTGIVAKSCRFSSGTRIGVRLGAQRFRLPWVPVRDTTLKDESNHDRSGG